MTKFVTAAFALAIFSFLSTSVLAAEATIKGEATCAKCSLNKSSTCETVIQSKIGDKTFTYWVKDNSLAKSFHEKICHSSEKVVATGDIREINGKKVITLTRIRVAQK